MNRGEHRIEKQNCKILERNQLKLKKPDRKPTKPVGKVKFSPVA